MAEGHSDDATRRDFLYIATGAFTAVGAGFAAWPLIHQMNPAANVLAVSTTEVDLSPIEKGQSIKVFWQGKVVFVRHRTEEEIKEAVDVPLTDLKDKKSENLDKKRASLSAEDINRAIKPEWLVVIGVCTHLGCIPLGTKEGDNRGEFGGWFCPCHGSQYDTAGRIRKGPAPKNLFLPDYKFLNDTRIRIG